MIDLEIPNRPGVAIFFAFIFFAMTAGCIFGCVAIPRCDHFTLNSVEYRPGDPGYDKAVLVTQAIFFVIGLAAAGVGALLIRAAKELASANSSGDIR